MILFQVLRCINVSVMQRREQSLGNTTLLCSDSYQPSHNHIHYTSCLKQKTEERRQAVSHTIWFCTQAACETPPIQHQQCDAKVSGSASSPSPVNPLSLSLPWFLPVLWRFCRFTQFHVRTHLIFVNKSL